MTNYVIINGVNSNTINGLGINELPPITKPSMRVQNEEIDGRDGDITTNLGYSAYDKTITIGLFGTGYDINDIVAFFNGEGTIVFSNESDKYYNFKIINQIDYVALQKFKTASITFHCQPFKYPLTETPLEIQYSYIEDEGENLTLNDTGESTLELNLKGNTSQTGTPTPSTPIDVNVVSGDNDIVVCGKNLFDKSKATLNTLINRTTGELATSTTYATTDYMPVVAGQQYTFTNFNYWYVCSYDKDKNVLGNVDNLSTITIPNNVCYLRGSFLMSNIDSVQFEKGNSATTYEAYQSQTYEVDLGTIELCKIGTYQDYFTKNSGKNLLPLTNQDFSIGDLDYSVDGGVLQATGSRSAEVQRTNNNFRGNFKMTLSAGTYKVNFSENGTKTGTLNYYIMKYSDNSEIKRIQTTYDTFTLNEETEVYLGIYSYQLAITGTLDIRIMLCKDDGTSPIFEPYGTGLWCKYNAIGKVVLDGSEGWFDWSNNRMVLATLNDYKKVDSSTTSLLMSNYYQAVSRANSQTNNSMCFYSSSDGSSGIIVCDGTNNTSALLKTWLSTHNTTLYYVLQTPYLSLIGE